VSAILKHTFCGIYTGGIDVLVDAHTDLSFEKAVQMGAVIACFIGYLLYGKALSCVLGNHLYSGANRH
jgi:hypothetical protein